MLKALKYCLLLITFTSAFPQQSDNFTNLMKGLDIVAETSCMNTDNIQNQDSDATNDLTEKYKDLLKELCIDIAQIETLELFLFPVATITHELGHAIAAESLF